jgi:flagellar hook-length control protein FliK
MSATPALIPTLPSPNLKGAERTGGSPDEPTADFAQVLDALLSPARAADPVMVPGTQPANPSAEPEVPAQGEPQAPEGTTALAPPILVTPQAVPPTPPQPVAAPVLQAALSGESDAQIPQSTAPALPLATAADSAPAFVRGAARAFQPASDESTRPGAAVEPMPVALAEPAKIAAAPMRTTADAATAPLEPAAPAAGAVAASQPSELVGLVPAERVTRTPNAPVPADPTLAGVRLDAPDLAEAFSGRVVWMAGRNQQVAEFRIDPPQLGPVEVRLSLSNDQASLVLLSPHASVRDALQATLPRLEDLLAGAGINLGSVHVGARGHSDGQARDQSTSGRYAAAEVVLPGAPQASGWVVRGRGMVDVYA